jgi:hypothetical protein
VAAAMVGLLAAAALAVGENGGVDLSGPSERGLIEGYLAAWYGGDYAAVTALTAPQRLRTGPSEERARDELAYQVLIGAEVDLRGCEQLPPRTIRCDVAYSNRLNHEVGMDPALVSQQFGIESGMVTFVAGPYLDDEALTDSFAEFADRLYPEDYSDACVHEPNLQSPGCAEFKLRHLEEWASWHRMAGR